MIFKERKSRSGLREKGIYFKVLLLITGQNFRRLAAIDKLGQRQVSSAYLVQHVKF